MKRFKAETRRKLRRGRGMNLGAFIVALKPYLRGWYNYHRLNEVKGVFEQLDAWLRRRLCLLLWCRWKKPMTRVKNLLKRGLEKARCLMSAMSGRGPWWNSGASHMNQAFPKQYFDEFGLYRFSTDFSPHELNTNRRIRNRMYGGVRGRKVDLCKV